MRPHALEPAGTVPAAASITTIAIPTAHRPAALARCVESYAAHQARFGRRSRLLIADDSTTAETIDAARAQSIASGRRFGAHVDYVTRASKIAYAERLAAEIGIEPALVR